MHSIIVGIRDWSSKVACIVWRLKAPIRQPVESYGRRRVVLGENRDRVSSTLDGLPQRDRCTMPDHVGGALDSL